jgi:hypothetical protein
VEDRDVHGKIALGYQILTFQAAFFAEAHGADIPAPIAFDAF